MKTYLHLLNENHLPIVNFFLANGFGNNLPVLTYLSTLEPYDRCIILEKLFENNIQSIDIIDKMVLAYVKNNDINSAIKIISFARNAGISELTCWGLEQKLQITAPIAISNSKRMENLERFRSQTNDPLEIEFIVILISFLKNSELVKSHEMKERNIHNDIINSRNTSIFEKAFNRKRSEKYKRGGRTLEEILKEEEIPLYAIQYKFAIDCYNNGQLIHALEFINSAIELDKIPNWSMFAFKANALEDLKQFENAKDFYEIAIDIATNDINVYGLYHQIGFCYFNLGNCHKAIEFYNYAIELKQQHPNTEFNPDQEGMDNGIQRGILYRRIYKDRANAYFNLGNLEASYDDCKKSLKYDENYSFPILLMAQIYYQIGQQDKALLFLRKAAHLGNITAIEILNQNT